MFSSEAFFASSLESLIFLSPFLRGLRSDQKVQLHHLSNKRDENLGTYMAWIQERKSSRRDQTIWLRKKQFWNRLSGLKGGQDDVEMKLHFFPDFFSGLKHKEEYKFQSIDSCLRSEDILFRSWLCSASLKYKSRLHSKQGEINDSWHGNWKHHELCLKLSLFAFSRKLSSRPRTLFYWRYQLNRHRLDSEAKVVNIL